MLGLLHYGMLVVEALSRAWDFIHTREAPYNSKEFVEAHTRATQAAVDMVLTLPQLTREQVTAVLVGVLRCMASAVQGYHRKGTVNANYMSVLQPTEELLQLASFASRERKASSFAGFLALDCWAKQHPILPNLFILPIDDLSERPEGGLLFGAPAACVNKVPYIVNDTMWLRGHARNQPPRIRHEIERYFLGRKPQLRSFVSLPVCRPLATEDTVIGCVNIQSDRKMLLGLFPGNQKKLLTLLAPLLQIVGYVHARLAEIDAQVANAGTAS